MLQLLKNFASLSFITVLIFAVSCTTTSKIDSTKPEPNSIQAGQSSSYNEKQLYYVQNNNNSDVKISKIDIDDLNFDIPQEEVTLSDNQSKKHDNGNHSVSATLNNDESHKNFFSWLKNITIFKTKTNFKEFEQTKRSSMAIAFNKAFTNGNMMPEGMMKEKGKASPTLNQNTIIGLVLLGGSLISLLLTLLFLFIPILALLFFLGFLGLGAAGLALLIKGLTE